MHTAQPHEVFGSGHAAVGELHIIKALNGIVVGHRRVHAGAAIHEVQVILGIDAPLILPPKNQSVILCIFAIQLQIYIILNLFRIQSQFVAFICKGTQGTC